MPKLSSILLVDDDSTTNFLNQSLIQRQGVAEHVLIAENGAEALQVLHQTCVPLSANCPNLILLDLKMPIMNGIEFLEAFTQLPLPQRQGIVIIMLTTTLLPADLERVQRLPVAGVLHKPLTKGKLLTLVQEYFEGGTPS